MNGNTQIIAANINSLYFKEEITDIGKHSGAVNISAIAKSDIPTKHLRVWITDKSKDMQEEKEIKVSDEKAVFQLTATSFTTLSTE